MKLTTKAVTQAVENYSNAEGLCPVLRAVLLRGLNKKAYKQIKGGWGNKKPQSNAGTQKRCVSGVLCREVQRITGEWPNKLMYPKIKIDLRNVKGLEQRGFWSAKALTIPGRHLCLDLVSLNDTNYGRSFALVGKNGQAVAYTDDSKTPFTFDDFKRLLALAD